MAENPKRSSAEIDRMVNDILKDNAEVIGVLQKSQEGIGRGVVFTFGPYRIVVPTSGLDAARYGAAPEDHLDGMVDLRRLFGVKINGSQPAGILKLRSSSSASPGRRQIQGLMVDTIVGNKPVMILRPGQLVRNARIFSGIGVLESGVLTPMLDVDMLAQLGNPIAETEKKG